MPKRILSLRCCGMPLEVGVAAAYVAIAALWIYYSDRVLHWFVSDAEQFRIWSTYKGWFYVALTAALLFWILRRVFVQIRRSRARLIASEERYQRVFSTAGDAMLLLDQASGAILVSNDAACAMYGYDHEEFNRMKNADLSAESEKTREAIRQEFAKAPVRYHRKKDGTVFPVEITASYFNQGDGRVSVVNIRDITGRKQAEEEITALSKFPSENPNPVMRISDQGVVVYANPASAKLLDFWSCTTGEQVPDGLILLVSEALRSGEIQQRDERVGNATYCLMVAPAPDLSFVNLYGMDISVRKQIENELRAMSERLTLATQATRVGIWDLDVVKNKLLWDDAMCGMYGTTREQFDTSIGIWERAVHPDDLEHAKEMAAAAMKSGDEYADEFRIVWPDGSIHHISARAMVTCDESGKPIRVVGTNRDITRAKEIEDALRLTQFAVEHATDTAFWILPDGRFAYVNESACVSLGYTKEELLSLAVPEVDPDMPSSAWLQHWEQVKKSRMAIFESHHKTKDGRIFPVEIRADYLAYGGNEFICAFVHDITDRKKRETELQLLSAAIRQAAEVVVITDTEGTIQYVNPAFETITGYARDEAIGRNPRVLKSGKHTDTFYLRMWQTLMSGKIWQGQFVNKRKDGTLYTEEAAISPMHNDDGVIVSYVAVKRDITKELHLEAQYRQSQKMDAVGQLAGGVAHDFNNILQTILGFCGVLLAEMKDQNAQRRDVLEIQQAAKRAAALTRQLLAFSRKQPIEYTVLDLNAVVARAEKMLQHLIAPNIEFMINLADRLDAVRTDAGQIEQIIINLVVNARDAMPEGGQLAISTGNVTLTEKDVAAIPNSRPGRYVCLAVSDTGSGMNTDVKAHLFEPFYTTKAVGKGTGLGLAVVYGLVQQHSGWVAVESEQDKGSIFKVYLPVYTGDAPVRAVGGTVSGGIDAIHERRERILLVEDDPDLRNLSIRVLQHAGYQVTVAENAAQALNFFEQRNDDFDLLFSDIVLPDRNGMQLADLMLAQQTNLSVLLCSGYTDDRIGIQDIKERGFHFLQKPFPVTTLLNVVRKILDEKRHENGRYIVK